MIALLLLLQFVVFGLVVSRGLHESSKSVTPYDIMDALLSSMVSKRQSPNPKAFSVPLEPAQKSVWKNCGAPDDLFQLDSLALSPDPPMRGANLRVLVKGNLSESLVGDENINLVIKLGVLTIIERNANLCEELNKATIARGDYGALSDELPKCPIEKGAFLLDYSRMIPNEVPPVSDMIQQCIKPSSTAPHRNASFFLSMIIIFISGHL